MRIFHNNPVPTSCAAQVTELDDVHVWAHLLNLVQCSRHGEIVSHLHHDEFGDGKVNTQDATLYESCALGHHETEHRDALGINR